MKKQSLVKFFVILFAILISTPLANYYFEIVPRRSLTGFKNPILPPLQVPSYVDGTFQADFDTWFHRKHGLWGYLVRLNNQFNFSIFHQISSGPNSTVLLGRHGFLFEKAYLTDFNHLSFNESRIESIASKLKAGERKPCPPLPLMTSSVRKFHSLESTCHTLAGIS